MAQGRFLSQSVAESQQLARLSPWAEILFYRCIPHLDREGRITGDPRLLKARVAPIRDDLTLEMIPGLLAELHEAGLVVRYEAADVVAVWFPTFPKHQKGMRKDREAPSRLPEPPKITPDKVRRNSGRGRRAPRTSSTSQSETADLLRTYSGPTPDLVGVKGSQGKVEVEVQGKEGAASGGWPARLHEIFLERVGDFPPAQFGKLLRTAVEKHGEDAVLRAARSYCAKAPDTEKPQFVNPAGFAKQVGIYVENTRPGSALDLYEVAR